VSDETPLDAQASESAPAGETREGASSTAAVRSSPPPADAPAATAPAPSVPPPRPVPLAPPRPGGLASGPRSAPPPRMASSPHIAVPQAPPPPGLPQIPGLDELAPLAPAASPAPKSGPGEEVPTRPSPASATAAPQPPVEVPPAPASDPGADGPVASPRRSRRTVKIPADSVPQALVRPVAVEVAAAPPPAPAAQGADDIIRPQRIIEIGSVPPPPPRSADDGLERGWTPMPPVVAQASLVAAAVDAPRAALAAPTPEIEPEPASVDDEAPTRRGEALADLEVPDAAPTLPRAVFSDTVEIPDAAPTIPGTTVPWAPGHATHGADADLAPMVPSAPVTPAASGLAATPAVHVVAAVPVTSPVPVQPTAKVVIAASALEPGMPPPPSGPFRIQDPETIDDIDIDATDSTPPSEEIPVTVDEAPAPPRKPPPPPPKRGPSASIPDLGGPPGAPLSAPVTAPTSAPAAAAAPVDDAPRARPASDRPPPAARPAAAAAPAAAPAAPAAAPADAPAAQAPAAASTTAPPEGRKRARAWWEDLFGDDYARTMDRLEAKHVRKDADFIEESLALEKGAVILDLACGAGQHAVELASRGYSVVGYDLSLSMLARAADEAQERGQKLNFLQGDMREMAFEETFDGIYCWGTSFGYFDEDKNVDVLARAHRALRQGGMLLLDVANRDYVAPRLPSLVWFEGEGCVCMDETYFDYFTSRLRVKRTAMFDDGKSREIDYSIRLYALHELGSMLHDAGYKVVEVTGHHAHPGVFFGTESPRILIVAEKG
jgi:SAM-dependent methyltransferase